MTEYFESEQIKREDKEEYNRLICEYQKLSPEEKQALVTFKSPLFYFMSKIMQIEKYEELDAKQLNEQLKQIPNYNHIQELYDILFNKMVLAKRMSKYPETDFLKPIVELNSKNQNAAFELLLSQLSLKCKILEGIFEKMSLEQEVTVYRGTDGKEPLDQVSESPIVSTSLDKDIALRFSDLNAYQFGKVYKIKIKSGVPALVCPIGWDRGEQIESRQEEIMFPNNAVVLSFGKEHYQIVPGHSRSVRYTEAIAYSSQIDIYPEEEIMQDITEIRPDINPEQLQSETNRVISQRKNNTISKSI